MQLFVTVLTEGEYMSPILRKLADNGFHGSVLATQSIKNAFMNSIEPDPYFGGISKVVAPGHEPRPMLFVVVMNDEEVKKLCSLVNEATNGIKGKGFMYSIPVNYLEGLDA